MNNIRVFLAFCAHPELADDASLRDQWFRSLTGEFMHCELVFDFDGIAFRVLVDQETNKLLTITTARPFSRHLTWTFLRIPCTAEQVYIMHDRASQLQAESHRYSFITMFLSGAPCVTLR
jgi:hypothetical protein